MLNQKVSITETELKKLKEIRPPLFPSPLKRKGCGRVKFDLPLNDQTISSFQTLVGKAHTRGWKAGVYIFTHKPTGSKYIGSPPSPKKNRGRGSNSLSRRLNQYFTFKHINQENSGQLLPLIQKEGFDKFSLEIFVMPADLSFGFYYLFLEQFHLLNTKF